MTTIVSDTTFQDDVIKASIQKPVLVDFWATWCGPCLMQAPILDEVAKEIGDKAIIAKLDVDANPAKAQEYMVQSIPTLKIFKNGKVVEDLIGVQSKATLISSLTKHI